MCVLVRTKDYQAAVDSFDKALEMAKVQGDKAAESAIRKAIEDVNKKIVDSIKEGDADDKPDRIQEEEEPEQEVKGDGEDEQQIGMVSGLVWYLKIIEIGRGLVSYNDKCKSEKVWLHMYWSGI